jgi:hypothetical protein
MKSDKIISAVEGVTKKWTKQRKREERERSAFFNRRIAMTSSHISIKDAVWEHIEKAYMKASAYDTLPAHARQVMYAIRPDVIAYADRQVSTNFDVYFTQQLLPDYIEEHGVDWDVVYDARGHFVEPYGGGSNVPLGTLDVRGYLEKISDHEVPDLSFSIWEKRYPTAGPENRYGGILFIEKEGFMPLFDAVNLAERYDIAIMSTKGLSNTASRELLDSLCEEHDIPLLVLHDFDIYGFSILGTLHQDTRRYQFGSSINVIDVLMTSVGWWQRSAVSVRERPGLL